jgi:hypothetical protein
MKNKIVVALGNDKLEHKENIAYPQIHVIDLTRRTHGTQSVEIYDKKPNDIDTLLIENPSLLDISATFFKPQCFQDKHGKELNNCEGIFYLTNSTDETWVLFLEIKDCKVNNISRYFEDAKKQIITVVKVFRDKNIIAQDKKVYANISFPRRTKTDFYNQLIKNPKEFLDRHKIILRGTNRLTIRNCKTIS